MEVTFAGIVSDSKLLHVSNALAPIDVISGGRVTDVKLPQVSKVFSGIFVIPDPITTVFKSEHAENRPDKNEVTLDGISADVRLVAAKQWPPIMVTLGGIVTDVKLLQPMKAKLLTKVTSLGII